MRVRLLSSLAVVATFATFAIFAAGASADPTGGPPICNGTESPVSGTYSSLTITGNQYVPDGDTLNVTGNLIVAPNSCLDAYTTGTVTVGGGLRVRSGAILGLGCAPYEDGELEPCGDTTTNDTVGGSLSALNPYTMYLSADTIGGNLVSSGGGPGVTVSPYVNYPIKDSTIDGSVEVTGWQGAWFGFLRNHVGKNAGFGQITGAISDSNEIVSNTVAGGMACRGNYPAAQVGDSGGTPNVVGKKNLGCP